MISITEIESRFKEVSGLGHLDLSVSHFAKGDDQCQVTTREEQKEFGWVTTPLWLVDEMIEPQMSSLTLTSKTCDACSGCGQFSIRLMRKFYEKLVNQGIPINKAEKFITQVWLPKNHFFTEFQFSNIAKLIYIFGTNINVYIGDSLNLKCSNDADKGLLFWINDSWENLPLVKLPGTPSSAQQLEPLKDNLPALLKVFEGLEKQLMTKEVKKREKKKIRSLLKVFKMN